MNVVAYVRDPSMPANEQGYRAVVKIKDEPDEARAALIKAFSDAANHLRRARDLGVALDLASEIEELIGSITALDARVRENANA